MAASRTDAIPTTNKNIVVVQSTTYDQMKFSSDIFDILDDDDANDNNLNEKQKWKKIEEEFNLNYQFDNVLSNIEGSDEEQQRQEFSENESINTSDNEEAEEDNEILSGEQVLSQRLSQLSTTSSYEQEPIGNQKRRRLLLTTSESTSKKFRTSMDDNTMDKDAIPNYLSMKNKLFTQIIQKFVDSTHSNKIEEIQQMAFFMHKIAGFDILQNLWSAYLRSGTGLLQDNIEKEDIPMHVDRRYWPNHVKSLIQLSEDSVETAPMTTEEKEQLACEKVAHERLHEYHEQIKYYQKLFDDKKTDHFLKQHWTTTLEETIKTLIQQHGIVPLRMKCDFKKAMLTHQSQDEILQRQYHQHHPTEYQKQIAQHLYDIELQLETTKSELIEHRQRVICNKPPVFYDPLQISLPFEFHTFSNIELCQQLSNRYEKLIQRTKTDLMSIYITAKQAKIYQYQANFNNTIEQMYENNQKHTPNKEISKSLLRLINQRSLNMKNKLKIMCDFTITYHIRNSYGDQVENVKNNETIKKNIKQINFLPTLTIDPTVVVHHLTNQQLLLLNRGPTYVAPCQIHLLFSSFSTMDNMISKLYAPLKHQLAITFDRYHIDISRSMNFQKYTYEAFKNLYSILLPTDLYQRATYEKKLIQSIQRSLKKNNLILRRTADQNNTFYLDHETNFTNVSNQYMEDNTDNYHVLINTNEMTEQDIQQELNKKFQLMNTKLEKLLNDKRFSKVIYKKFQMKSTNLKLPYLYFLPDVSTTNSLRVQPMIAAHHSATSKIALFLTQLLRPVVVRQKNRRIFVNEADFMEKLNYYANEEHHLHPTTLFATIKITNFHTMTSHKSMVTMLVNYLNDNSATNSFEYTSVAILKRFQTISIDTFKKLTELYLENNIFYYNGKIYEFTKGAPNSLLLSEILSNIYLFTYDKLISDDIRLKTELYGRYKDQLFFTWNRSQNELVTFLDTLVKEHSHIHMETSVGRGVHFLNAQIENRNGHLYTCVYHDSHMPKYTLPYVVGHAKLNHSLWLRSALIRAVRFCSNYADFNQEQSYLEMTCLANGYSVDFIEKQFEHFYIRFNAEKIRFCLDQTVYERLRRRLFDFLKQQDTLFNRDQELEDTEYKFHFTYPYDYGSYNQFNEEFHKIWSTYLKHDEQLSHQNTKVILHPKHIYSLNTMLAQEKPSYVNYT